MLNNETTSTVKTRAIEKLRRDAGSLFMEALNDPETTDLMLNADGQFWQRRFGEPTQCIGRLENYRAAAMIKTVAGFHGLEINHGNPLLECELPIDGSRFSAQMPSIVAGPTFTVRKKAIKVFTLAEYVQAGILTEGQKVHLQKAISNRRNILIVGGTGSGKTTLINALIDELVQNHPNERLIIIEDTGEIQCDAANAVHFHTTIHITLNQLIKTALRMRPDRILVGEVRGPDALDLLDAWNTGHEGGFATLHANNALAGLQRLKSLSSRHPQAPKDMDCLIGDIVHLIVDLTGSTMNGPFVRGLLSVNGFKDNAYCTEYF